MEGAGPGPGRRRGRTITLLAAAAGFQSPTSGLQEAAKTQPGFISLPGFVILPGGEPITIGGQLVGIAVHIGARVLGLAEPGEVLVSSTVRDLVAGSGIEFDDRGDHALKGIAGQWHLYAARAA